MSSRPQPQSDTETPPSTDSRTTETPAELANLMASHLLVTPPEPTDRILIPGANAGELRDAVTAHCTDHEYASRPASPRASPRKAAVMIRIFC